MDPQSVHGHNTIGVADHTHSSHDLGKIATRDDGWWLVIDAALEALAFVIPYQYMIQTRLYHV